MPEPVSASFGAATAGAGAYALSAFGFEPAPLLWALVGASLGMSFAPPATRTRALIVFGCVVLVCSLFGAWLSVRYTSGEQISRNAFACFLAIIFHPLLTAAITKFPAALDGLIRRWTGSAPDAS